MHGADLTAVIGFHPNLNPLQRHKGVPLPALSGGQVELTSPFVIGWDTGPVP